MIRPPSNRKLVCKKDSGLERECFFEIPRSKSQDPNSKKEKQLLNLNLKKFKDLRSGIWDLRLGIWNLEFGTWNFVVIFLLSAAMFSCKLGPNYVRPVEPLPKVYNQDFPADSSIANLPWWSLFNDTVLENIIRVTLENNKDLKSSVSRMNQAKAAIGIVRADMYPTINYSAGGNTSVSTGSSGFQNDYSALADVSYTFDVWGKINRLNEAALQDYLATEEAYRALKIMLIAETAIAYITLRDLDNRLAITEQTTETWKANLEIVKARYKGGFVSEVDLNMARIQLLEAQTAIQTFTRLRRQMENAISALMGMSPQSIQRGLPLAQQVFPPELPAGLPSELLDRRPDILLAERQLNAQTERIGAAEALKYPSFTINANTGLNFVNPFSGFASMGAQILGPIFNSKANDFRIEIEKERTIELLNNYEKSILLALREVEDAMVSVTTYKNEFELRKEQVMAARDAVKLTWIRYDGGLTNYLEVLDLQRSSFNSELKASEAFQLQLTSTVRLYQALGGGWDYVSDTIK
jgi:multidrug efflux system outer membrane protein